jgi:hypothetical protein
MRETYRSERLTGPDIPAFCAGWFRGNALESELGQAETEPLGKAVVLSDGRQGR